VTIIIIAVSLIPVALSLRKRAPAAAE